MRRIVSYRLSFRLTGKDIDLLWLDADERTPSLSVLVKKVLRGIVDGKQEVISLPAVPKKKLHTKTIGVTGLLNVLVPAEFPHQKQLFYQTLCIGVGFAYCTPPLLLRHLFKC